MEMNDYQAVAHKTAVYPDSDKIQSLYYAGLGLSGEAGEVAGKLAKMFRDGLVMNDALTDALVKELGDVLWYVAEMANMLGVPLEAVAQVNVMKLMNRQSMGTIKGEGDDR